MAFPKYHTFRGSRCRLLWRRPKKRKAEAKLARTKNIEIFGRCGPPGPGRKVYICKQELKTDPLEFLGTLLHECAGHACNWDLDEDAVTETYEDMVALFRKMKMKISFEK